MKSVVYRANSSEDSKEKKENMKPVEKAFKEALAVSLHSTMKPVVFKGIKKESRCGKENVAPRPRPSAPLTVNSSLINGKLNDTGDSELWSEDEEVTNYRTQMAGVKAPKVSAKASTRPVKPRQTNPFKIQLIAEVESKPVIVPQEVTQPSIRTKIASNAFRITHCAFEDIKKQKMEDMKRLNGNDRNINYLENYHTAPFMIPGTRMREMSNQIFFQVELVEFTSPSQFMFQHNQNALEILLEEME